MKNIVIIVLSGLIGFSCNNKGRQSESALYLDSIAKEKQRITFINDTSQIKWFIKDQRSFWTPSKDQISEIDSILVKAIREQTKPYHKLLNVNTFKDFYRQYVCCVLANGDSIVYINAICRVGDHPVEDKNGKLFFKRNDWQHDIIHVMNGGDCFWQIWINYSKKNYKYLIVNGLA
ncbi:MAG: hypothetical protein Q8928_04410 [Bacteroidota bacterium]|nr:hypothetical protein [Bacteroidota bacterium]